jgi:hypothetical protein
MMGLSGLITSSAATASVEDILGNRVSMMAVTSARSLARSLKELSGACDEGLGGFDSLTVNG